MNKISSYRKSLLINIAVVLTGIVLIIYGLKDNFSFFYTPSELKQKNITYSRNIKLGGLVKDGSINYNKNTLIYSFILTDNSVEIKILYKGLLPDLFREGQGIIAIGTYQDKQLIASQILAKHDEKYIPKKLAEELKKKKLWRQ